MKQQIRKEKNALRRALDPQILKEKSEHICQRIMALESYKRANVIMAYQAMGGEVSLDCLIRDALEKGKRLGFPLCLSKTEMEARVPFGEKAYKRGAFGIWEPDEKASAPLEAEEIELVIVPCVAFDEHCRRLGMGGGYYDRYLPKCRRAWLMAAAFELQKVPQVPVEAHDRCMDQIITEERAYGEGQLVF
jgi:5-formyltetrahydrofolate cyclo-ligase